MLEDIRELAAVAHSAEAAYEDWARVNPDGTDLVNSERRYAPGTRDARFRDLCGQIHELVQIAQRLQEAAISDGIEHTALNNRQLAVALGVSHPKVGRRRTQIGQSHDS